MGCVTEAGNSWSIVWRNFRKENGWNNLCNTKVRIVKAYSLSSEFFLIGRNKFLSLPEGLFCSLYFEVFLFVSSFNWILMLKFERKLDNLLTWLFSALTLAIIVDSFISFFIPYCCSLGVRLVVLPSQRDVHHEWVYPQPPFAFGKVKQFVILVEYWMKCMAKIELQILLSASSHSLIVVLFTYIYWLILKFN